MSLLSALGTDEEIAAAAKQLQAVAVPTLKGLADIGSALIEQANNAAKARIEQVQKDETWKAAGAFLTTLTRMLQKLS